jgi:hypothetical protein
MALPHKSLVGGRILCPKKPRNPNVEDEEKADFSRIPINTYYYVHGSQPGVFSSWRDFSTTRSASKYIIKYVRRNAPPGLPDDATAQGGAWPRAAALT